MNEHNKVIILVGKSVKSFKYFPMTNFVLETLFLEIQTKLSKLNLKKHYEVEIHKGYLFTVTNNPNPVENCRREYIC